MKKPLVGSLLLVLAGGAVCLGLFVWGLHPWARAGTAQWIGNWQFGDYEFQVWQRKNRSVFEPFADGLFVRRGTGPWQAFCFDIQDNFSAKVELREADGKIHVFRDGENRGFFDMSIGSFRASADTQVFTQDGIGNASQPPGQWRLR